MTFPKIANGKHWIHNMKQMISQIFREHSYMGDVLENKMKSATTYMGRQLAQSYHKKFMKLLLGKENNQFNLNSSIKFLSKILSTHFQRPTIVLIDEYDASIMSMIYDDCFFDLNTFIEDLLRITLKDNKYVFRSYITGITRIAKGNLFSDLNHIQEFGVLDQGLSQHYGFSEEEIKSFVTQYNQLNNKNITLSFNEINEWYNGYKIGNSDIFNPWSITNFLKNCNLGNQNFTSYWIDVGNLVIIQNLFNSLPDCDEKNQLLSNQIIRFKPQILMQIEEITKSGSIDSFFSYLVHAGYLTKDGHEEIISNQSATFRIPNKEIMEYFSNYLLPRFIKQKLGTEISIMDVEPIVISLGKLNAFKGQIQTHYLDKLQADQQMKERDFQSVLYSVLHLNPGYGYDPIQEKYNMFRKKLDRIFFAKREGKLKQQINGQFKFITKDNLTEYKVIQEKYAIEKVQNLIDNALWQICVLLYFKEVVNVWDKELELSPIQSSQIKNYEKELESLPIQSSEKTLICRAVVFYKHEQKWQVAVEEFLFMRNQLENLIKIFSSLDGKNLLDNYQDLIETTSPSTKKLQRLNQSDIQSSDEIEENHSQDTLTKKTKIQNSRIEFLKKYKVLNMSQFLAINSLSGKQIHKFSIVNNSRYASSCYTMHTSTVRIKNQLSTIPTSNNAFILENNKFLNHCDLSANARSQRSKLYQPISTLTTCSFLITRNEHKLSIPIMWFVKKFFRK